MNIKTKLAPHSLCFALTLGATFASTPAAQAQGLFGGLLSSKPALVELTDTGDKGAIFIKAFSDSGALSRDVKRAVFAERKAVITSFQIEFATEQIGQAESVSGSSAERLYTLIGVTDAQMQAITDGAFAAFSETLKNVVMRYCPRRFWIQRALNQSLRTRINPPLSKSVVALKNC